MRAPSALVLLAPLLTSCAWLRGYAEGQADVPAYPAHAQGLAHFLYDDLHGINTDTLATNASAWKFAAAALVQWRRAEGEALPETDDAWQALLQRRYGFLPRDATFANWPKDLAPPTLAKPVGMVAANVERSVPHLRMEVVNQGCGTCHAANLYAADGSPTPGTVWLGLPSGSIHLKRFAEDLYQAFLLTAKDPAPALATMDRMYPDMDPVERRTLERFLVPTLARVVPRLRDQLGGFQPFDLGGAGLTNGVGAMKTNNRLVPRDKPLPDETAFTSIPDFGALHVRTSLLFDGVYTYPGWEHEGQRPATRTKEQQIEGIGAVATLFTIGTMGVDPDKGPANTPAITEVVRWAVDSYAPPPFPGPIDADKAARGRGVYDSACAGCHGTYDTGPAPHRLVTFPNRSVSQAFMGTDPTRWEKTHGLYDEAFARTPMGKQVVLRETNGYIALPLTSLWATAPYLHNGSVPTLWHLMHPEARPATFQVGGHALDLERVGIRGVAGVDAAGATTWTYPDGFTPWMLPDLYDTRQPGHSNAGHTAPFDSLSEPQKDDLLAFLKTI
jgi:mono/diheme cytochrome c family protein